MKIKKLFLLVFFSPIFASAQMEGRPDFCRAEVVWGASLSGFEFEVREGVSRLMRFQFGNSQLAGLAVGNSDAYSVARVANSFLDGQFCTWYINQGNPSASTLFHWVYLPKPSSDYWLNKEVRELGPGGWEVIKEMYRASFARELPLMLTCLRDYGYLAMGCNGMRERGPTLLGMLFAYAGCTPEEVSDIVNPLWGRGWLMPIVSIQDRNEVLQLSYELGASDYAPQLRNELIKIFQRAVKSSP